MRFRTAAVAISATALLLTACGGDDSGSSTDPSSSGSSDAEALSVGIILPDTESSVRWETADRPFLESAFADAGIEVTIQNAEGDADTMSTIADQMITQGVGILAIVNLDSDSGAAIQQRAEQAGVVTIDYDRLTLGGSADYYVSFDNTVVGELQGQGLADCMGAGPKNIIYLNGSPTDNNATLFAAGAHSVLDGIDGYTAVGEQAVPDWDNAQAATIFEQLLTTATAGGSSVDGVLAANDGLGNAAISILGRQGLSGTVPVTGQDATAGGLQNVLAGTQCMTVYKSAALEAGGLVDVITALVAGDEPETTGTVEDATGDREVPSILLTPQAITRDTVKDVVDDGGITVDDLCTADYAAACTELGIS